MMAGGGSTVSSHWSINETFMLINLLVVFGVIYFFGKKGILTALRNRKEGIADKLVKTREELKKMRAEIELARKQLASINDEKKEIIANVEQEGAQLARRLIDDAQQTAERIVEDTKMAAKSELQNVQQQMKTYVIENAINKGMEKVRAGGDERLNPEKMHNAFIEKFIQELPVNIATQENSKGASNGHSA